MKTRHVLKLSPALVIAATLVSGCAHPSHNNPPPAPPPPTVAVPVSGTELDQSNIEKVRLGEVLKAYPVNRYIDPKDPNLLHEAHIVYRKEASAGWNLTPHAPTVVPLGPMLAVSDPAEKSAPTNADIEQRMTAQTRLMAALTEQNETLTAEITRLNSELALLRESEPATTTTKEK